MNFSTLSQLDTNINQSIDSMRLTLIYNISKYMALLTCLMLQICWSDEKVAEEV